MKYAFRSIVLLAATLAAVPLSAQATPSGERARAAANSSTQMPVIIPAGTPLTVAIDEDLSSASVNQGQQVAFHLPADYSEFGHVLIAQGTAVQGTVAHVARRSAGGNPGAVTLSVTSLRAVDGTRIPLRGTTKVTGKNRQGQAAALGVLTFGIGATKKGLSAVIPAGTQFTVFTDAKRTIVVAR
jgi:hypothetical protein